VDESGPLLHSFTSIIIYGIHILTTTNDWFEIVNVTCVIATISCRKQVEKTLHGTLCAS